MAVNIQLRMQIVEILAKSPNGMGISELAVVLKMAPQDLAVRRALQRSLKSLVDERTIEAKGQARARRYFISSKYLEVSGSLASSNSMVKDISLSSEGQELLKYINRPIAQRTPAGYNQRFLKDYIPNKKLLPVVRTEE